MTDNDFDHAEEPTDLLDAMKDALQEIEKEQKAEHDAKLRAYREDSVMPDEVKAEFDGFSDFETIQAVIMGVLHGALKSGNPAAQSFEVISTVAAASLVDDLGFGTGQRPPDTSAPVRPVSKPSCATQKRAQEASDGCNCEFGGDGS